MRSARFAAFLCDDDHLRRRAYFSCTGWILFIFKRTLNLNARSAQFYSTMNREVMREIMEDLRIGAGVFSP